MSRANNPVAMAEAVLDLLDKVPGARVVFLSFNRGTESLKLYTAKSNDPEPDRWRAMRGYYEVGTYTKGAAQTDLIADFLEVMARVR